jgi:site-specific DNA-methyltransferase (adenine-specific)
MKKIILDSVINTIAEKSKLTSGLFTSRTEEWETPNYVFLPLNQEFKLKVDVCATSENAKCKIFFNKSADGLKREWSPFRCWMNPPYGRDISKWMKKAFNESQRGALVVCLIPSRTDTKWWHDWVMRASEIRFVSGRISFGSSKNSAPFPSCIVIYYPELENPYKLAVPVIRSVSFDKAKNKMRFISTFEPDRRMERLL